MRLTELRQPPRKQLGVLGFTEYDEETTDPERWVWFRKQLFTIDSLNVIVEVKYSLSISDYPYASYDDNCSYSFEECTLITTYREVDNNAISSGDEDSFEWKTSLSISTTENLQAFVKSATAFSTFL